METKTNSERILALAKNDDERSTIARLRDVFDAVEAALSAGVRRSSVISELALQGLIMTPTTFATTLKRIRKQRGASSVTQVNSVSTPQKQLVQPKEIPKVMEIMKDTEKQVVGSHDPRELDKIFNSRPDMEALSRFAKRNKL